MLSEEVPHIHYLEMQDQWFTFNMFDAQAWLVRDLVRDRLELPGSQERRRDVERWLARLDRIQTVRENVEFQAD
ncbi:hypothetical protein [Nesterenkonia aurantiaca]|uniref:Uncharacterized protein n=1 Tax=Nesterenkonia aurantiaca TaxID=1436010 RepID=A0A4R7G8R0_9MICC|nr:hypothetical protein [Nesterenkonia aurantiaca]TDS87759.1 hypothetical protein EV640_101555 [Nesterenkonia aurantiaca]